MLNNGEAVMTALMIAASTVITRFIPFILFSRKKDSAYISYLGEVLPYASIGLLVIYCLKSVDLTAEPYAIPELIAIISIIALHCWRENTLLSIGTGTAIYMFIVQYIMV